MAVGREINVAHRSAGLTNRIAQPHRHEFQMGEKARPFLRRQGSEQVVLAGVVRGGGTPDLVMNDSNCP